MPFRGVSLMDQRGAFVSAARIAGANVRELCRTYAISPTTGYKWLDRAGVGAAGGLADRSRRPHRSPRRTAAELEAAVVAVRLEHPRWGGRKIHHFLKLERIVAPPHPNTVTDILRRHGLIDPVEALRHRPFQRFEHDAPNRLWQMDFKRRSFALCRGAGGLCQRAAARRAGGAGGSLPDLWPARTHADGQRSAVGNG